MAVIATPLKGVAIIDYGDNDRYSVSSINPTSTDAQVYELAEGIADLQGKSILDLLRQVEYELSVEELSRRRVSHNRR
ncbi:MAG: hypothetical protein LBL96_10855 [Clostridiales bacterium]|jgi:hypothetical protein|nr:hypothetical protein [Clostridiales bacterium]